MMTGRKDFLCFPDISFSFFLFFFFFLFFSFLFFFFLFFFFFSCLLPEAYGNSQARGLIGAVAASLHHSQSNARSKLHLQPTPQLTAMADPE